MKRQIVIYGAGAQGKVAQAILKSQGFPATAFSDKNSDKEGHGEEGRIPVISHEKLRAMDKNTLIVIGIGAHKLDVLRDIDYMLTEWGFTDLFWSATELIEYLFAPQAVPWKDMFHMQKIDITTSIGCPITCRACPQKLFISRYKMRPNSTDIHMPFDTFKACIDKLPVEVECCFAGMSEPFHHPRIVDFMRYAFSKNHKVSLNTTLVGATAQVLDSLRDVKFCYLILHLPDRESNATIAVTDEYLEILEKFVSVHWRNIPGHERMRNFSIHGELDPMVRPVFEKLGINPDMVNNMSASLHTRGGNIDIDWHPTYPVVAQNFKSIVCARSDTSALADIINKDDEKYLQNRQFFTLFPNGDVALCSIDAGLENVLGNLVRSDYHSLYVDNAQYSKVRDARQNGHDVVCRKCFMAVTAERFRVITRHNSLSPR